MEYDPDYQGLYINAMTNLLNIFNEENIKDWLTANAEKIYVQEQVKFLKKMLLKKHQNI